MKKGISPIIASVLLIAFTLSVAMLAGPFFSNTLKSIQSGTLEDVNKVQTAAGLRLELVQVGYNKSTGNLSVTVRNDGDKRMDGNLSVGILGSGPRQQVFNINLTQAEITTLQMPVKRVYYMDSIQVALTEYPVSNRRDTECLLNYKPYGYWSFDNGETNSGWAIDQGFGNYNGSISENVTTGVDGIAGEAYHFRATESGWVQTDNPADFGYGPFTVAAFYKLPKENSDHSHRIVSTDRGGNTGFYIMVNYGTGRLKFSIGLDHILPETEKWTHVAIMRDSSNYSYAFHKGSKVKEKYVEANVNDKTEFAIGKNWNGSIDEVNLYDRSLSNSEVKALSKVHTRQQDYRCELKTN